MIALFCTKGFPCILVHVIWSTLAQIRSFLIGPVFEDVAGLAVEGLADCLQRREADRLGLAGFQDRQIGHRDADALRQFGDAHFSFGQHDVYIDDYRHFTHLISYSRFLA
jgi:hypothetical protein